MYAIDSNRIATGKQRNAVYAHYTNILGNKLSLSKTERYTLFNRIRGAMTHYYLSILNSSMTHGDVQEALQAKVVPSQLLTMIKIPESKEPKVVKQEVKEVKQEVKEVKQEVKEQAPKKRGRPKGSKNSMTISSTNERIDQLENKLNKILEILSK